jgi:hypothetical protein
MRETLTTLRELHTLNLDPRIIQARGTLTAPSLLKLDTTDFRT